MNRRNVNRVNGQMPLFTGVGSSGGLTGGLASFGH